MRKPMIGLVPLVDEERQSYWMLPGYMKGIEQAGGIPVMLPLTSGEEGLWQIAEEMDGFLYTGGQDISPSRYAQKRAEKCGQCCKERDEMETILFRMAYEKDRPLLGICRGIQSINVFMGGTLYQDLPSEHPSDVEHHQSPPYDAPVHSVTMIEAGPLYELLHRKTILVNSYHHQAIRMLAPKMLAMAVSEDGLVEAAYVPGKKFIWGIQWHPELLYQNDENSRTIFSELIRMARQTG